MEYQIYQEKNPTFRVDDNKKLYNKADYKLVWEDEINLPSSNDTLTLANELYTKFNVGEKPEGYKGHSLSVGDIIEFENGDKWICASFGWNKVEWENFRYNVKISTNQKTVEWSTDDLSPANIEEKVNLDQFDGDFVTYGEAIDTFTNEKLVLSDSGNWLFERS